MRKEKNRLIEMKLHIYQDKTPVNCFSFHSCSDFFSSRNNWLTCCRSARRLTMKKGSNILHRNIWHFFCKIIFVYISYLTIYLSINFSNYLSLYVYIKQYYFYLVWTLVLIVFLFIKHSDLFSYSDLPSWQFLIRYAVIFFPLWSNVKS